MWLWMLIFLLGCGLVSIIPLGTDDLGRDELVRLFTAGRTNLVITVSSVLICLAVGTAVGMAIGSGHRALRAVALRLVDALLAIPFLILVLALVVVLGSRQVLPFLPPGVATIIIAIVMVGWAPYARLAAAQTLVLRQRESVVAARLLGYSRTRILVRHIGPGVLDVNASYAATQAVHTTALTASLAFLGTGVQEPTPELGAMMHHAWRCCRRHGGSPSCPVSQCCWSASASP